ncbi:MAG: hypothetical protein NW701_16500 [Nitrospira sp.]
MSEPSVRKSLAAINKHNTRWLAVVATFGGSQGFVVTVAGGDSEHCSLFHSDEVKEWNELHS